MCNKRSCKKGGFLLLGAILGFIFGMFFAPKKGSELRKET
ncbi:TPA: YtxH domain-containing protein, partial [Clostridioides difficile]|nr:YtxH domain-containing protein [Clostridioides difficile]